MHHAEDGKLTSYGPEEIETVAGWWGEKGRAVEAMLKVEFLKPGYIVVDWPGRRGDPISFWRHWEERERIGKGLRNKVLSVGLCLKCGATDKLTVDHIIPRARGGSNKPANLQCLCLTCNTRKSASLGVGFDSGMD